jgi:restriction system protein
MDKFNAEYGIFITTSDFSQDAVRASRSYTRMVTLINGTKIAELVRRYHLHAQEVTAWVLDDYFFHPDRV